jgi:hypothetical protein
LFFNIKDIAQQDVTMQAYSFLSSFQFDFQQVETIFLGIDLLTNNNISMTILAAALMYCQMKFATSLKSPSKPNIPGMDQENMPDMSKMM